MFGSYGDAPVDEIALAERVEPHVRALRGAVPDVAVLRAVTDEHGLDFATMLYYRAVHESPEHGEFVRRLDARPAAPVPRPVDTTLLVVPAMFHRERPDLGGDGRLVTAVARACGYRVEVVPTESRGSLSTNAAIIRRAIREHPAPSLWLFSLSKGGGEVRVALQEDRSREALGRVRGWINASGIVRGSHFIDQMLASPGRRLRARAFCLALGTSYAGMRELQTTHEYWSRPFEMAPGAFVINLVGVPLGCHVQRGLVGRYRRLGALGPNDGFVLLPQTVIAPGPIYPIWGSDHLFRSPLVSPLLYRLFGFLQDGVAGEAGCPTPDLALAAGSAPARRGLAS
jgi:hypothetical protein